MFALKNVLHTSGRAPAIGLRTGIGFRIGIGDPSRSHIRWTALVTGNGNQMESKHETTASNCR